MTNGLVLLQIPISVELICMPFALGALLLLPEFFLYVTPTSIHSITVICLNISVRKPGRSKNLLSLFSFTFIFFIMVPYVTLVAPGYPFTFTSVCSKNLKLIPVA